MQDTARLLMLLTRFGSSLSVAFAQVAPSPDLVDNGPLLVLSSLELDGPQRPHDLAETLGMTTGGVSKLLDRMEELDVVTRRRGVVPDDRRAVVVEITPAGRHMMRRITEALAAAVPQLGPLVREISSLVEPA